MTVQRARFVALLLASLGAGCTEKPPSLQACTDDSSCAGEKCLGGVCRPLSCTDGRPNGYETDVDCGGIYCVACGTGQVCLSDGDCSSGGCVQSRCGAPLCSDGVQNGAETDIDCGGACGACDDGKACVRNADCRGGVCSNGGCGNPCALPLLACGGACVDPRVDRSNCGACGVTCPGDGVCQGGQCAVSCAGGSQQCGPMCVDLASDPAHCGSCTQACGAGEICLGGACLFPCPVGQMQCGGACVSLDRDPQNCGQCGMACPMGSACVAGQCSNGCASPLLACDNGLSCVDPRNDPMRCGGCNSPCPVMPHSLPGCSASTCVIAICQPGFGDCNGNGPDGCETDLGSDDANCGACARACGGGSSCMLGHCCGGPLPAGTYQTTCSGCVVCDGLLSCQCEDGAQVLRPTSIPLFPPCPGSYSNCDGTLRCGSC